MRLQSLVLVGIAVLIVALSHVDRSRFRRTLWPVCLGVIGIQFTVTTLVLFPPLAGAIRQHPARPWVARLAPGVNANQPFSVEAAARVLDRARELTACPGVPVVWYLSGNSAFVNVPRLRLYARLQHVPVNFLWGNYFTWGEKRRAATRAEMRSRACVVVLYEPVISPGELADLNPYNAETRAFVTDPANGFEALGEAVTTESYSLALFVHRKLVD